jgi:hypothetical protein
MKKNDEKNRLVKKKSVKMEEEVFSRKYQIFQ